MNIPDYQLNESDYLILETQTIFSIEDVVYLWQGQKPPKANTCDECRKILDMYFINTYGGITGRAIADLIEDNIDMSDRLKVTRQELIEVANKVGIKPKFLFKEMREGAKWNEQGTPGKKVYQELIKVLLHELNLDPNSSDTVGKIERLVSKFQISKRLGKGNIARRSIEGILKDIEPSRARPPKSAK